MDDWIRIAIKPTTKKQLEILSAVYEMRIYGLVGQMVEGAWSRALDEGLVSESMMAEAGNGSGTRE